MELKLRVFTEFLNRTLGLNCTVMELKQANQAVGSQHGRCLNCTVMELKQGNNTRVSVTLMS